MRKVAQAVLVFVFGAAGWFWHLLDIVGRGEVALHLEGTLGALQGFVAKHQEIGWQIAPWVVMISCVVGLAILQWPQLLQIRQPNTGAANPSPAPATAEPPVPTVAPRLAYLTPYDTILYLANESQWAEEKANALSPRGMGYDVLLHAPLEFQERAAEGHIRVFGYDDTTHKHEEINMTHWMSFGLEVPKVFDSTADVRTVPTTFNSAFDNKNAKYSDLKISALDVYRTWPRSPTAEFRAEFDLLTMSKDDAKAALWNLRKVGVAIRNEHVPEEGDYDDWKARYEKWRGNVLAVADKFDQGLHHRLEVLDQVRLPPRLPSVNNSHARDIAIASEILLRLDEQLR